MALAALVPLAMDEFNALDSLALPSSSSSARASPSFLLISSKGTQYLRSLCLIMHRGLRRRMPPGAFRASWLAFLFMLLPILVCR